MDIRSKKLRKLIVMGLAGGNRGHIGPSMSLVEILRVLYDNVLKLVENHNKTVYVYGLDGDYERKPFGQLISLIPIATSYTKCLLLNNFSLVLMIVVGHFVFVQHAPPLFYY